MPCQRGGCKGRTTVTPPATPAAQLTGRRLLPTAGRAAPATGSRRSHSCRSRTWPACERRSSPLPGPSRLLKKQIMLGSARKLFLSRNPNRGEEERARPWVGALERWGQRALCLPSPSNGCAIRSVAMHPPVGRVGRGPGWSPGRNLWRAWCGTVSRARAWKRVGVMLFQQPARLGTIGLPDPSASPVDPVIGERMRRSVLRRSLC